MKAEGAAPPVCKCAVSVHGWVVRSDEDESIRVLAGKSFDYLPVLTGYRVLPEDLPVD